MKIYTIMIKIKSKVIRNNKKVFYILNTIQIRMKMITYNYFNVLLNDGIPTSRIKIQELAYLNDLISLFEIEK